MIVSRVTCSLRISSSGRLGSNTIQPDAVAVRTRERPRYPHPPVRNSRRGIGGNAKEFASSFAWVSSLDSP